MTVQSESKRNFSVVIKLSEVAALNGELKSISDPANHSDYLQRFFREKYGDGGGKLHVTTKSKKIKLTWIQPLHSTQANEIHRQALRFAKQKNYQDAINAWVRAIVVNPNDPDYYFNLGIAFFELKNYTEAIENLKRALSLCPIYYKALLILGTVYLKTRKFENAEHYLKESLFFYPRHPLAYLNLGAVYSIMKRYEDGIRMFLKTIELSPNEVRAHFGLAKIYTLSQDSEKADKYYQNVIQINTNQQLTNIAKRSIIPVAVTAQNSDRSAIAISTTNVDYCYGEGYRAFLFSDYNKAVEMYQMYVKHKPADDFVWYSLGEASLRAGQTELAANAFNNAIQINSNKALYYKELAITYNYLGQDSETLRCLARAEQLGKNDSISYTVWGKVLLEQKIFEEANNKLTKALKLNPNNLLAKFNLAIAALHSQQKDIAVNQLHEIIQAPISSPIKMEAEKLLKKT